MKVEVDADRCQGHGVCCTLCPDVFALTDAGYAIALATAVAPEHEEAVRAAVNQCPVLAITASG